MPYRPLLLPLGLLICVCASLSAADETNQLPATRSVKPQLYATGFEFAEGPALNSRGDLFVVNYRTLGKIGRITKEGTASVFCDLDELAPTEDHSAQANGLKIDSQGRLIAADAKGGRLLRIAADGHSAEVLADRYDGSRFQSINDVALDLAGDIFFTDPDGSTAENPVGSVYCYSLRTARVSLIDNQLAFPNGLAVTPDQRYLCVGESRRHRLLIYDLQADDIAGSRRVLIDFPQKNDGKIIGGPFQPDGMIFDAQGRLYVAMWGGGVINVVEVPSGKLIRQYDAGGVKPTNCHFYGTYLYVTLADKEAVFRLNLGTTGWDYNGSPATAESQ